MPTWALKSPRRTLRSPDGNSSKTPLRDPKRLSNLCCSLLQKQQPQTEASPNNLKPGAVASPQSGILLSLQAINAAIQPHAPNIPNPYTILSKLPPDAQWFSVVSLTNAFSVSQFTEIAKIDLHLILNEGNTLTHPCLGYCKTLFIITTIIMSTYKKSVEPLMLTPG